MQQERSKIIDMASAEIQEREKALRTAYEQKIEAAEADHRREQEESARKIADASEAEKADLQKSAEIRLQQLQHRVEHIKSEAQSTIQVICESKDAAARVALENAEQAKRAAASLLSHIT